MEAGQAEARRPEIWPVNLSDPTQEALMLEWNTLHCFAGRASGLSWRANWAGRPRRRLALGLAGSARPGSAWLKPALACHSKRRQTNGAKAGLRFDGQIEFHNEDYRLKFGSAN